jgi:2-polyprenyl-3-methyl-5-hydroxy-6-metoxy-1,4-benzoquinol methylase
MYSDRGAMAAKTISAGEHRNIFHARTSISERGTRNHGDRAMGAPTAREHFDRAYRARFTFWGDVRVLPEIKGLTEQITCQHVLELGCGLGRFAQYVAQNGLQVTAVDFSSYGIL